MKVFVLIIFLFVVQISAQDVPRLKYWATDQTNTLNSGELNNLNTRLKTFQDTTSNQLVVLMIATLDGYPLEDYSYAVAKENKIGTGENDNGALLFIAKEDRKLRIEVGYGLEGALPDALSSSIIRNVIVPHFKRDNYFEGISEGVNAIIAAVSGEYTAPPEEDKKPGGSIFTILMIIFFLIMMFSRGGKGGLGKMILLGGLASGGFRGGGFGGRSSGGGFGGFSGGG